MAFPSIGSFSFVIARGGSPLPTATRVHEITRPNIDSQAYRDEGKHAEPVQWTTEADTLAPSTLISGYLALQGTLVTVVDNAQVTYSNVIVLRVQILGEKKVLNAVGGLTAGNFLVTAGWILQGT